ncbi:MAG TPA: GGDEF domain-containing protein [Azospira sp.]|nr:GGDEF domain-containing protein [Azospira sp.]
MKTRRVAGDSAAARPAENLTQVLGQSEHVKDVMDECAEDLSLVNANLKREAKGGELPSDVATVIAKNEAVEVKVQDASVELSTVNQALSEEVEEREILESQLVTATKQGEEARHASLHDPLTGLPNRALFNDRLQHALAQASRHGYSIAVLFMDLDNFKTINDSHGHDAGDIVLRTISARLRKSTRAEDTICRHGGDEFLYLLMEISSEEDITAVVEQIIDTVRKPCRIKVRDLDIKLSVTPSIGISIFPKHGISADELLDSADKAMYRAKRSKSGYQFAA